MYEDSQQQIGQGVADFLRDEQGPTGTEYAIMLALIALVSMGTIGAIGAKFQVLYTIIADALPEGLA
jgi:Flp pilus assembly pilin Flp